MINIKMKVSGISPSCIPVNELNKIIMKTIPLAPIILFPNRIILTKAEIIAVSEISPIICFDPYFSSRTGPISKIKEMLPRK